MKRMLVQIDRDKIQAVEQLKIFGDVKKVSFLLNIFSVEGEFSTSKHLKDINGVISVEEDFKGDLMLV